MKPGDCRTCRAGKQWPPCQRWYWGQLNARADLPRSRSSWRVRIDSMIGIQCVQVSCEPPHPILPPHSTVFSSDKNPSKRYLMPRDCISMTESLAPKYPDQAAEQQPKQQCISKAISSGRQLALHQINYNTSLTSL